MSAAPARFALTVRAALAAASARLASAGIPDPRREARLLLRHAAGLDDGAMVADPGRALSDANVAAFDAMVARRVRHEPIAYILGEREFWSLPIRVTPATLIPRPDTETIIEAAIALRPDRSGIRRVLDLGSGSGCLLLAALSEYPAATGIGVDASVEALAVAKENARVLNLDGRAEFRHGDWFDGIDERFDLILANPPYVPNADVDGLDPDVRDFEPHGALSGGADGLDAYRAIAGGLGRALNSDAVACFEVGTDQAGAVADLFAVRGFRIVAVRPDLAGVPRVVAVSAGI